MEYIISQTFTFVNAYGWWVNKSLELTGLLMHVINKSDCYRVGE